MTSKRIVRLFRNGSHQEVRIPQDLELPGTQVILRKEGKWLVIEPMPRPSLLKLLATWEALDEGFPESDDLAIEDVDL